MSIEVTDEQFEKIRDKALSKWSKIRDDTIAIYETTGDENCGFCEVYNPDPDSTEMTYCPAQKLCGCCGKGEITPFNKIQDHFQNILIICYDLLESIKVLEK